LKEVGGLDRCRSHREVGKFKDVRKDKWVVVIEGGAGGSKSAPVMGGLGQPIVCGVWWVGG